MTRCANIDWLEVYCLEDGIGYPHDAEFFRHRGWEVKEREYGTPMYEQMFTLYDHYSEPFIEVRRLPKSSSNNKGIFDPYSAHVRLVNRACYATEAARLLAEFLETNGFWFQRISRIDLCYDFEYFDYGDDPKRFLERFMKGRYSKINQANISAHGLDQWDGRVWNSISWGSPSSMVTTRFYNKTMELRQVKDKPYIRQAWQLCGLIDDMKNMTKTRRDGTTYKPEIWRVEFAIKSSTRKWFVVEDYNGDRKRILSKRNTLDVYYTRAQIFQVFLSLAKHYFHFKHVVYKEKKETPTALALSAIRQDPAHVLVSEHNHGTRQIQRKDRCPDKVLFRESDIDTFYQVERLATQEPRDQNLDRLLERLYSYRAHHFETDIRDACTILIQQLETETRAKAMARPYNQSEIEILRRVIAIQMKNSDTPVSVTFQQVRAMYQVESEIWQNPY